MFSEGVRASNATNAVLHFALRMPSMKNARSTAPRSTIVVIDDDVYWLKILVDMMERLLPNDVRVVVFSDNQQATAFVQDNREDIFGYVQDIMRPGYKDDGLRTGITFLERVITPLTPRARTMIVSAYWERQVRDLIFSKTSNDVQFLQKQDLRGENLRLGLQWLLEGRLDAQVTNNIKADYLSSLIEVIDIPWAQVCAELAKNPMSLYKIADREFERLVAELFRTYGWDVQLTGMTRDGGYDILAIKQKTPSNFRVLVEAKRFAPDRSVGVDIVRALHGVKVRSGANQVVIATSSFVSPDAKNEYSRLIPWELDIMEYEEIIDWCREYDVVTVNHTPGIFIPGKPPKFT